MSPVEMEAYKACTLLDTQSASLAHDLLTRSDPLLQTYTRSLATARLMPQHLPLLPRGQGSQSWSVAEHLWHISQLTSVPMSLTCLCRRISHLTYLFTQEKGSHDTVSDAIAAASPPTPEYWDVSGYVHGYHNLVDAPPHLVDYDRKIPLFTLSKFPLATWASYFRDQCGECARFYTQAGSIEAGLTSNHTNICTHADILCWLAGGWRLPFISEPPPGRLRNHDSLLWSPASMAPEVVRMREWGVLTPGEPHLVHPCMAVVRDGDLANALRLLRGMGRRCEYSHKRDIDKINEHIARVLADPPPDHPDSVALLKKVKVRMCVNASPLLNPHLAHWPFSYCSVNDAIELIQEGSYMAKIDLEKFFNQLLLHVADWKYLGVNLHDLDMAISELQGWQDQGVDVKQSIDLLSCYAQFGVASFPALANALMAATSSILRHMGIPNVFLTDDVFLCAPTREACQRNLDKAVEVMLQLGWRLQMDKVTPPAQQMVFLGIEIDTIRCRLSLPEAKLMQYLQSILNAVRLPTSIMACQGRQTHSTLSPWVMCAQLEDHANGCLRYKDLESLIGKLNWIAEVLIAGRARVRRLSSCLWMGKSHRRNYSMANLSAGALEDLKWWSALLSDPDTVKIWVPFFTQTPPVFASTFSDAAGDVGYSLIINQTVYQGLWAEGVPDSSGFKELMPLLLAVQQLGEEARGRIVLLTTDNVGNVYAINKGSCKSDLSYSLLARIFEIAAKKQIYLVADWVPRDFNNFSDAVSRYPWVCHNTP